MKTIPFDIALRSEIQSEENGYQGRYKVQTRNGKPVRIICWDKKDSYFPIVALVMNSAIETSLLFCKEGKYFPAGGNSDYDLLLVDTWEPKFKVGDRVKMEGSQFTHKIVSVRDDGYMLSTGGFIEMRHELLYSLVTEESELTEFEKELANCLYKSIVVCNIETLAKECAPKLLELAKKEIIEKLKEE